MGVLSPRRFTKLSKCGKPGFNSKYSHREQDTIFDVMNGLLGDRSKFSFQTCFVEYSKLVAQGDRVIFESTP